MNDFAQKEQIMKYKGITIHKNKTCDTWYTRVRKNGKQIYISARTQREVYNKLKKEINEEIKQIEIKSPTLLEWYKKWLVLYKVGKVKQTTLDDYTFLLKNLSIEIQNKPINEITIEDILMSINNCHLQEHTKCRYYTSCYLSRTKTW